MYMCSHTAILYTAHAEDSEEGQRGCIPALLLLYTCFTSAMCRGYLPNLLLLYNTHTQRTVRRGREA